MAAMVQKMAWQRRETRPSAHESGARRMPAQTESRVHWHVGVRVNVSACQNVRSVFAPHSSPRRRRRWVKRPAPRPPLHVTAMASSSSSSASFVSLSGGAPSADAASPPALLSVEGVSAGVSAGLSAGASALSSLAEYLSCAVWPSGDALSLPPGGAPPGGRDSASPDGHTAQERYSARDDSAEAPADRPAETPAETPSTERSAGGEAASAEGAPPLSETKEALLLLLDAMAVTCRGGRGAGRLTQRRRRRGDECGAKTLRTFWQAETLTRTPTCQWTRDSVCAGILRAPLSCALGRVSLRCQAIF